MSEWQYVGVENWYLPCEGYGMTILLWQAMMPAMSVVPNVLSDKWETFAQKWVGLTQRFSCYNPSPKVVWNPKAVKYLFSHPAVCLVTPFESLLPCIFYEGIDIISSWQQPIFWLPIRLSLHYWFISLFLSLFFSIFWPASPATHLFLFQLILSPFF